MSEKADDTAAERPLVSGFEALHARHVRQIALRTTLVQLLLSALVAGSFALELPVVRILGWMILLWTALAIRWALVGGRPERLTARDWEQRMLAGASLVGGAWGCAAFLFGGVPQNGPAEQALVYVLAGVAAAGGVLHAPQPRAAGAFLLAALLPLTLVHLLAGGLANLLLAGATLLYVVTLFALVRHLDHVGRGAFRFRSEKAELSNMLELESRRRLQEAEQARAREQRLEAENESRYRELFGNFDDCILFIEAGAGAQLTVALMNRAAERMFGTTDAAARGLSIHRAVSAAAAARVETLARAALDCGATVRSEEPSLDGSGHVYDVTVIPLRDFSGRIGRLAVVARDVTEQKLGEQSLRERIEQEARLSGVLAEREAELRRRADFQEVLLHGIADAGLHVLVAEGGKLVYVTDGLFAHEQSPLKVLYEQVESASRPDLLELVEPEQRGAVAEYYRRRIAGEPMPRQLEIGLVSEEGLRREFELAVSVLPGSGLPQTLTVAKEITDRKRMERELRRSRDFLQTVIDGVSDPVMVKDTEHRFVLMNEACCVLLDRPRERLLGKTDHDYLPAEQADANWSADDAVFLRGQVHVAEGTLTGADGRTRYYQFKKTPITNAEGERLLVSVLRDITDRRRTEELLAARERELRTLVDNLPDVVVRYDLDCRRIYVSPSFEKSTGVTREAVLFRRPRECWGEMSLSPEAFEERLGEVIATGRPGEATLEGVAPDGRQLCHLVSMVPEFLPDGRVASVLTVARDVSELKRAEALLHAREEAFRSLAENSPDTIARYDRTLRRVYANPAFVRQAGVTPDVLLGKTPAEFPGGASASLYQEKMEHVFASGEETGFELTWKSLNAEDRCTYIRIVPERTRGGEIASVLAIGRDITEIDGYRRKIFSLAYYDPMTGLANRVSFNERLHQTIAAAERLKRVAALIIIDLDRFKNINDTLGHAIGDELLGEAGKRLMGAVRGYDTVARLGGDEYAVLMPEIRSAVDAGHIAGKILKAFAAPFVLGGRELFVTASLGVALYPDDGATGEALLKYADSAMYHAKTSGRNNFQFYRAEMTLLAEERLRLEEHLRKALANREFSLHYQPQVTLDGGHVIGAEALLRWHNPELGDVSPERFIGIAEDTGLIVEIGAWVLREACRAAAAWNSGGHSVRVAVNLSTRQFRSWDLVHTIMSSLAAARCRPEWIELEITESLLLEENVEAKEMMEELRARGLTFAIDDFGTGYSALSYLRRFPIQTIKIDRTFISGITSDPHSAALVRAIISMAEVLQLALVAEGVESTGQCELLREWGAGGDLAQGYLFGRPMARPEFEAKVLWRARDEEGQSVARRGQA